MTTTELAELKRKVEAAKSNHDKALGSLDSIKRQIKELGFNNIKELKSAIDTKNAELTTLKDELDVKETAWREKYADLIATA